MNQNVISPDPEALPRHVEAARYALLRRLAFAMRHEMVVHLQPIGLIGEVLQRRLQAPTPALAHIQDGVDKLTGFSKAAVQSCLDVITWLAPEPSRAVPLDEGIREIVELMRSSFSFRGFVLLDAVGELPTPTLRGALRHVLPASLLLLTDGAGAPAEISISASAQAGHAELVLSLEPTEGPGSTQAESPYRPLDEAEVQALAHAEGMTLRREGDTLRLRLPLC